MFIVLLANIVNASLHTKCASLSNQKCKIQPTLINLHPNGYNQELHYYPFVVNLGKCAESCNTLNDLSNRVCVPNKTEDLNIHAFNMIIGKKESKILTKDTWWNNNTCECRKHHVSKKDYVWNPATRSCQNGKYLVSIMADPAIICDEVIESYNKETKPIPTNFNEKKATCKMQHFYNFVAFLLITIALLIAVSTYCYLIKY